MDVKEAIISALKKVLEEQGISDVTPKLTVPNMDSHGDYSTNVAMTVFTKAKSETPLELAQEMVQQLNSYFTLHNSAVSKIETAPPGFINFWLSNDYLIKQLDKVLSEENKVAMSVKSDLKGKKIMVEFTDPNPFKEFHIGHLFSNIVGESLSRLFEGLGADVKRVCYQGDVGLHVAKAVYGLLQNPEFRIENVEKKALEEKAKILGEAYALGSREYEATESAKKEIHELNKKIYERTDSTINQLYDTGKEWSLEYFDHIYKRLGTTFWKFYFESEAGKRGLAFVKKHIKKGIFEEDQGAVVFKGEPYGLHTRVFINSLGLPTYEAKEMGLAPWKYQDYPYDESVIVTGNEINQYFKVLLKALSFVNNDLAQKTRHISHGMVRLPQGKMSSRSGNVITGEWLLDEAKRKIHETYKDMEEETAEVVAIGAIKYAFLKSSIGKDIEFDFDESVSFEGNSGPYIQYTYVRTQSLLAKAKSEKRKVKSAEHDVSMFDWKLEIEEIALLRLMSHFEEVVIEAATQYAPHLLCTYLFNLASAFNVFYQKHKIIPNVIPNSFRDLSPADNSNEMLKPVQHDKTTSFRLALTAGVGKVLKQGLYLLGIDSPERM